VSKAKKSVLMAVCGGAHGTGGEVRVKSFTGDSMALGDYGPLHDRSGRTYRVQSLRLQKTVVIVRFEGVDSRTKAEALNGAELFIDRTQLPDNLGEDEFYQHDLIGLMAFDVDGRKIGRVAAFFNFGGGDLLELAEKSRGKRLVPFSRAAVPHIDIAAGCIVIDAVAVGLWPDEDDGAQGG